LELVCPRCRFVVPFTGAFEFVMCPNCRSVVRVAFAARAPSGVAGPAPTAFALPPAYAIEIPAFAPAPPLHIVRRVARASTAAGTAFVLFLLVSNLAALLVGVPVAWAYATSASDAFLPIYLAFPFPIVLFWIGGLVAAVWHLALVAVILLSAGFFLREHLGGAWAALLRALEGRGAPPLSDSNGLFAVTRLFTATLLVAFAVNAFARAFGQEPAVPASFENEPFGATLIALAHASVWEELVTRVLLLGVPLLAIHAAARGRLEARPHQYLLGGRFALEGPALALLLFQAAVFSAAHIPGWDPWKIPGTFVTGMALGFLFLRYGIAACVLLHFLNDYLGPSIVLTEQTAYPLLIVLCFYFLLVVGVVNFGRYLFVLREVLSLGRIPEYLGGPAPTRPEAGGPLAGAPPPLASPAADARAVPDDRSAPPPPGPG